MSQIGHKLFSPQYIVSNLFIVVSSNVPRFFHYEYTRDESDNLTFMTTLLSRDNSYNHFWHAWQSLTNICIPFTALGTINGRILWNLAKSKQNDAEMNPNDGLRIHVGWEYEISRIQNNMIWLWQNIFSYAKFEKKNHSFVWKSNATFICHEQSHATPQHFIQFPFFRTSRNRRERRSFVILFTVVATFLACNALEFVVDIFLMANSITLEKIAFCYMKEK